MKTKNLPKLSLNLNFILILPVIILTLAIMTGCSSSRKAKTTATEVGPPLPPPPPPPPPNTDNQKVVKEADDMEVPFVVVEQMPVYPGGDEELLKFIATNTKYPETAKANGVQGKVIVRFCITSKGKVSQPQILRGVSPELDAEALRVVSSLAAFEPGVQGGRPVPVWYMVPITFALDGSADLNHSRYEVLGNDTIYTYTNQMPKFPGGYEAMSKFKTDNVKYDPQLKNLGVEGFVEINAIIEKNGTLSNIKISQGVSPSLDGEAIRVTRLMPAWEPGRENGKAVRFRYMMQYEFLTKPLEAIEHTDGEPYVVVEQMPMFPGGDSALLNFIAKNTKYPEASKIKGIQGRVIARFCVTETGSIDRVSVLKGVSPDIDEEALRVVQSLPPFKPGKQGGKAVAVWYMVPITFALAPSSAEGKIAPPPPPPPPPAGYDEIPVYKGGEVAMYKFINSKIVYPPAAKEKKITGKVRLMMCISTDGTISETNVMPGSDPLLSAEAVRVVKLLPAWTPGKLAGTPVKVWYPISVTFTLK